jgi:hypothetical protein
MACIISGHRLSMLNRASYAQVWIRARRVSECIPEEILGALADASGSYAARATQRFGALN